MNKCGIDMGGAWIKISIIDTNTNNQLYTQSINYKVAKSKDENNNIPEYKIEEILSILKNFINLSIKDYNVSKDNIFIVATGGYRQANNGIDVINRLKDTIGINIKLIDGYEEANLTWKGIVLGMNNSTNTKYDYYIACDIGSSSTEITIRKDIDTIINSYSIDIGNTNFTKMFDLSNGSISNYTLNKLILFLKTKFDKVNIPTKNNNIVYILTGSSGFNPLIYNDKNLTDTYIKTKSTWNISINMVYDVMKRLQVDKSNFSDKFNISDVAFAESLLLYFVMRYALKTNNIIYSTWGLRHGIIR